MSKEITEITANIVAAFVSHNSVQANEMPDLLSKVHDSLYERLRYRVDLKPQAIVPAMPIKKSITHNAVFCLVCGDGHKMLKRHLRTSHDLDPETYREMFGLHASYSLTAPSYSETRSGLAKLGLGRGSKSTQSEPVAAPGKPALAKKAELPPVKPVRSHSKAEQTRRKNKAPGKDQNAAEAA